MVQSGLPAYLLIVDGFIVQNPERAGMLSAGAQLFALYGSRFARDQDHAAAMTRKARGYGQRAICLSHEPACQWEGMDYEQFVLELDGIERGQVEFLYAYAVTKGCIPAHIAETDLAQQQSDTDAHRPLGKASP